MAYEIATFNNTVPSWTSDPFWDDLFTGFGNLAARNSKLRSNVYTDKEKYFVEVELPGIEKKDISVGVENGILKISAEYKEVEKKFHFLRRERVVGKVEQSFQISDSLDSDKIDAEYKNGLLKIAIPLKQAAVAKQIEVQ